MAHSTDNYKSGGLIMQIALWDGVTPPELADLVDIGNVITFSVEPKITKKPHTSHRGGKAKTDKKIVVKTEGLLKWSADEFSIENLRNYFQGVISGTSIKPFESANEEYLIRITEYNVSGTERVHEWSRVEMSAAAALEMINHGEGEGDWAKMDFQGEILSNETPITFDTRLHGEFGLIYVKPTV